MRSKQITRKLFVLACLVLFTVSTVQAKITFVDAWTDNTTLDGATLVEGVNYTTSSGRGALDGLWHFRTRATNGGGIWSSDTGGDENTEPLITTFTILAPGTYDIYWLYRSWLQTDTKAPNKT